MSSVPDPAAPNSSPSPSGPLGFRPSLPMIVRTVQIVFAALVIGLVSGIVVMTIVAKPQVPEHQWLGALSAAVALAATVAPAIVPSIIRPSEQAFSAPDPRVALAAVVVTRVISRAALCDGVGFANALVYFLTGSPFALGGAVLMVVALVLSFPTQAKFDAQIDRWLQERRDESQFGPLL